jgi:CRISPR/Cas system CSM-associated protein Csm3 (group 7 of RAMP superfamily)
MHKALFLEGRIRLTLRPDGPIMIKAGETGGADPTRPDMEFVRTHSTRGSVYIPGPSLKGVVRAHAERICRTIDQDGRDPDKDKPPLADNPLGNEDRYRGLEDMRFNSGRYVETKRDDWKKSDTKLWTAMVYRRSAFTAQIFGHTALAGRVRFADAYGEGVVIEERNGVAIDRVYGSVAVGPFNYETVVAGTFPTTIDFRNVTLAQLGLLGLVLRDLAAGRVALGFGKSRGLGRVTATFDGLTVRYPTCALREGRLVLLNGKQIAQASELAGLGAFPVPGNYGLPDNDVAPLPEGLRYVEDDETGIGVKLEAPGEQVVAVLRACMPAWKRQIGWTA